MDVCRGAIKGRGVVHNVLEVSRVSLGAVGCAHCLCDIHTGAPVSLLARLARITHAS